MNIKMKCIKNQMDLIANKMSTTFFLLNIINNVNTLYFQLSHTMENIETKNKKKTCKKKIIQEEIPELPNLFTEIFYL